MHHNRKILMVVAQSNFRDEEFEVPKEIFAKEDYQVETVSERRGDAIGKFGTKIWIDYPFAEANVHNYAAIVFVGGPGAEHFISDDEALNLARDADSADKVIGAICIAPLILASAGLLQGKNATVCQGSEEDLQTKGATYENSPVVVDGRIITASGPEAAEDFAKKIVEALSSSG